MDMDQDERVVWPRDSLFRYFELLEKLQYNLEERKQLQEFAGMPWMLGVKFIRAAYIYLGRESMFTVVASQPLNFYITPKKLLPRSKFKHIQPKLTNGMLSY